MGGICPTSSVELTKQHKALASILVLGVGAIVVDRSVLRSGVSGPADAAAAVTPILKNCDSVVRNAVCIETLAARTSKVEAMSVDDAGVANSFVPPSGWTTANPSAGDNADSGAASIAGSQFRLSSVMTRPVAAAVVNGTMLRAGQSYAFGVCADGKFGALKQEEIRHQRKLGGTGINTVRLISVEPRSEDSEGGAVIEVDGTQINLVIEKSEKN